MTINNWKRVIAITDQMCLLVQAAHLYLCPKKKRYAFQWVQVCASIHKKSVLFSVKWSLIKRNLPLKSTKLRTKIDTCSSGNFTCKGEQWSTLSQTPTCPNCRADNQSESPKLKTNKFIWKGKQLFAKKKKQIPVNKSEDSSLSLKKAEIRVSWLDRKREPKHS